MLKCSDLQQTGVGVYYITRRAPKVGVRPQTVKGAGAFPRIGIVGCFRLVACSVHEWKGARSLATVNVLVNCLDNFLHVLGQEGGVGCHQSERESLVRKAIGRLDVG